MNGEFLILFSPNGLMWLLTVLLRCNTVNVVLEASGWLRSAFRSILSAMRIGYRQRTDAKKTRQPQDILKLGSGGINQICAKL